MIDASQDTFAGRRPERYKCVSAPFRLAKLAHFSSQVYGMAPDVGKEMILVGVNSFFHSSMRCIYSESAARLGQYAVAMLTMA